ncbi:MAG: hypothetical protein ABJA74_00220 [Lapillicoccus sp.]
MPRQNASLSAPARRRALVRAEAQAYAGVLSRTLLNRLGVDFHTLDRELRSERWRALGLHTICVHLEEVPPEALRWRAVWETGPRVAVVDGVSALQAAGLTGYDEPRQHVSVPHGWRPHAVDGVRRHHLTRIEGEIVTGGLPRVRPEIAAVRAAHWAASDRQAALVLVMAVQQGIVNPPRLLQAARVVRARKRRALVPLLVQDIVDGARSLGELDFASMCRRYGLPEPDRQVVRRGPRGRIYLDVRWSQIGLVVEIDGSQHRMGLAVTDDNLRQNEVTLSSDRVLRIDLMGLRLMPDPFMAQIIRAHALLGG